MKQLLLRGILVLFVMASISSCSKDDALQPLKIEEQLLTDNSWINANITIDSEDEAIKDIKGILIRQYENYQISFKSDKSYIATDDRGSWTLVTSDDGDDSTILFTPRQGQWKIAELTETSLKVYWTSTWVKYPGTSFMTFHEMTIYLDLVPKK